MCQLKGLIRSISIGLVISDACSLFILISYPTITISDVIISDASTTSQSPGSYDVIIFVPVTRGCQGLQPARATHSSLQTQCQWILGEYCTRVPAQHHVPYVAQPDVELQDT